MNTRSQRGASKKRPASTKVSKKRRSKGQKYSFNLPFSRQIVVALRKSRTSKARRSKQQRQIVISVDGFGWREIAVIFKKIPARKGNKQKVATYRYAMARPRALLAIFLILAGLGSAAFFSFNLQKPVRFSVVPNNASAALAAPPVSTKVMPRSVPVKLQIPKIGVDANLTQVGLEPSGKMEMPWDIETASWYKYSPTPGEVGPSIIVGHLDGAKFANMSGVFFRLHELMPGDEMAVYREDGSIAKFKIIALKQVSQYNFPTNEIYGKINYAGLRVITCGGVYDEKEGHYSENTVVFAALE